MKRNNFFSRFIVVTLTAALLLVSGSRAVRVSALALPSDSFLPIYDTQIVDIQQYLPLIEESGGDPVIFFILCGLSVVSYAGFAQYKLELPYDNPQDALEWISNIGVRLYNSVASLSHTASVTLIDPLLDYIHGAYEEYNRLTKLNVNDINTFIDYYNSHPNYSFKVDKNLLPSVNQIMALNQKLYDWQFSEKYFSNFTWYRYDLTTNAQTTFNGYTSAMNNINFLNIIPLDEWYGTRNLVFNYDLATIFNTYHNFFINTTDHKIHVVNDAGQEPTRISFRDLVWARSSSDISRWTYSGWYFYFNCNYDTNLTIKELFDGILNYTVAPLNFEDHKITLSFKSLPIKFGFYWGSSWNSRQTYDPTVGLNFEDNPSTYVSVPYMDTFINIRDIITDISSGTDDLYDIVFDNIYDINTGINLVANDLYDISVALQYLVDNVAPPIPVNMNDIAELTDNSYLERVKEHARNAGDIFANYVAFWHNCDSDIVYTFFGAGILVLVGAFIGKWGHS